MSVRRQISKAYTCDRHICHLTESDHAWL